MWLGTSGQLPGIDMPQGERRFGQGKATNRDLIVVDAGELIRSPGINFKSNTRSVPVHRSLLVNLPYLRWRRDSRALRHE